MPTESLRVVLRFSEQLRRDLAGVTGFARKMQAISDDLKRQAKVLAQANEVFPILIEAGWPPLLDITARDAAEVVRYHAEHGLEDTCVYLAGHILALYTDDLVREKLNGWERKRFLTRRVAILKAGVEAHLRGDYACSIPTLLPQAEGIVNDCFAHVQRLEGAKIRTKLEALFASHEDDDVLGAQMDAGMHAFFLKTMVESVGHRSDLPLWLNRHVVLHGRDVDYDTRLNSLRAILCIDYLQTSYVLVAIRGSDVYHITGCPSLMQARSPLHHFPSRRSKGLHGKRPCKLCRPPNY